MQFSNVTTEDGIIQEINRICGTTDNTYSLKAKTARANQALDRFFYLALTSDGTWEFDDANYIDLPIGVTDIVSGQQDYAFASDVLTIEEVMAKSSSGTWSQLTPVDITQSDSSPIWLLPTGNSGSPVRYDKYANSIFLDPIPNYNSTGGLKVAFKRNASKFVSTDTIKTPGIPSIFHEYLARYASLPFLIEKNLKHAPSVAQQIQINEQAIQKFFNFRVGDVKRRLIANVENTR